MSATYWSQWSHSELMSMHGVELDEDFDADSEHDECESDSCQKEEIHEISVDSLGLSWRDFM